MNWFIKGIKKGIKTEKFPQQSPEDVSIWSTKIVKNQGGTVECPTKSIEEEKWNPSRCIFCGRCYPQYSPSNDIGIFEIKQNNKLFKRSFYLYPIDIGTCGGCNFELKLLTSPQYDMSRFGIFFTNTPRHADALLVMGVITERMKEVLERAYDAMPNPKLVIALGTCAISGGLIGNNPEIKPDVIIYGCPPNPYTILKALIKAKGE
ncbi:NADH-quinone oxidoreductase subunit B family protein [Acidianus manzaensis]|uniref:NADH:ubiquinone oxidoreductase n=1 Tax=Acidianus manzaensis TaxID=282676 RepID=A0A1W6K2K0_9CREN|nr:NADH:ubiquinone oxidoreductase [Acidianus manzaensis]ARM76725.1 NADH:ubiquinone oxidoreductase [Acidianus manzaensis]